MEAWTTLAWILMVSGVADRLKTAESRDFTQEDIVLLHPSTTPHPGAFKCFTCQDAADNYQCNRWAPDVFCPKDSRYCYTLHVMDDGGGSVSVSKRCASLQDCAFPGCADVTHRGHMVCSSCCEGNICNVLVPRNQSAAVFSFTSPLVAGGRSLHLAPLGCVSIAVAMVTAGRL